MTGRRSRAVLERFSVTATVTLRRCAEADLPDLEWHGMYTCHRAIIAGAFARQQRGEVLMLVAEHARFPVGQVWIDFVAGPGGAARIWAFRVMPCLQGLGIGARLLRAAERVMAEQGVATAEVGCLKSNSRARRYYEQRGYAYSYDELDRYGYETPAGERIEATSDQWILSKALGPGRDQGTQ